MLIDEKRGVGTVTWPDGSLEDVPYAYTLRQDGPGRLKRPRLHLHLDQVTSYRLISLPTTVAITLETEDGRRVRIRPADWASGWLDVVLNEQL